MTKHSSYGSWTRPRSHVDSTEQAPASSTAKARFGWGAVIFGVLGCAPGFQGLWALAGICVFIWLLAPAVAVIEASAVTEAKTTGGGGCQVGLAGLIILALIVGTVLVGLLGAGGGM